MPPIRSGLLKKYRCSCSAQHSRRASAPGSSGSVIASRPMSGIGPDAGQSCGTHEEGVSPARVRRAGGVRMSKPIRFRCARRWWSLVTSGTLAAELSAANFRSSGSSIKAKSWGSTRRVNSPSGRKRSANLSQRRGGIRRKNKLGLAPGRTVPNQLKTLFPDSREDTRRCAFRVESRGYEDIRVDDNPFHQSSSTASCEGLA